jgi:protein SCO1/2
VAEKKSCCNGKTAAAVATVPRGAALDLTGDWQTDDGAAFALAQLRGRPVVISMFYASCEGICVITKDDLKAVEASLPATARARTTFVLVTLAPDLDSAAALKKYRTDHGLSEKNWTLLRGSPADTAALAAQLGIAFGRDRSGLFRHSSVLTVLDETGTILLRQDGVHADLKKTVAAVVSGTQAAADWSAAKTF